MSTAITHAAAATVLGNAEIERFPGPPEDRGPERSGRHVLTCEVSADGTCVRGTCSCGELISAPTRAAVVREWRKQCGGQR